MYIAEIGWNFMGDMSLAEDMISAASKSGATHVKFQYWREENLKPGEWDTDGRREIYQKAELTQEKHISLKKYCDSANIEFLTSVFNKDDLKFLSTIGMKRIKIPSHEVANIELIKEASKYFEHLLISTGAAKWEEVLKIFNNINPEKVTFLHCVSTYPCDNEKMNLPRMASLKKLGVEVGYSGHCIGINDAIAAIANGAKYIEKHFTIDNDLPGRDNKFAILPSDLKVLSKFAKDFEIMNIDRGLDLQKCELDTYNNYRGRWSS